MEELKLELYDEAEDRMEDILEFASLNASFSEEVDEEELKNLVLWAYRLGVMDTFERIKEQND